MCSTVQPIPAWAWEHGAHRLASSCVNVTPHLQAWPAATEFSTQHDEKRPMQMHEAPHIDPPQPTPLCWHWCYHICPRPFYLCLIEYYISLGLPPPPSLHLSVCLSPFLSTIWITPINEHINNSPLLVLTSSYGWYQHFWFDMISISFWYQYCVISFFNSIKHMTNSGCSTTKLS